MGFLSPCGITTFPSEKLRDELTNFLAGQSAGPGKGGRTGAFLAGEVLSAQFPDTVTEFVLDNRPSASALPAGVPVVDHLRAFLSETPGFDRLTVTVDNIRRSRLPAEDVSVKEVILGKSTPNEFLDAAEWVRIRQRQTQYGYGVTVLVADVEELCVETPPDIIDSAGLLKAISDGRMRYTLTRRGYKGPKASFPVLLMFGSIDWQLHLMFHVEHRNVGRDRVDVIIGSGELPHEEYRALLRELGPATGTGIEKDYSSFFRAVNGVYGNNGRPRGEPFEIARLAKLAGADHPQTSVLSLCYTWLGGVAPKHWKCSTGDCMWGRPYSTLPYGLQMYLLWDIQQMAKVALVMLWVIALHIFPDPLFMYRVAGRDGTEVADYWCQQVIHLMGEEPNAWGPLPVQQTRFRDREGLLESAGIPTGRKYGILRFNPPWPAVTNGGPRFDHQVCDWYRSIYATLREYDQDFFPFLDHQTLGDKTRSLLKSRRAASADVGAPSSGRPLAIHPSVAGAAWIALPYDMLTHENIRAEASSEPGMTIRLVMNNYFKYDIGRSQRMLQYWEEDKQRMIKLFGPDRYVMLAIDLREVLRAHGMLPYRPPGWVDPLGEDQFNIMKEWNLKKHHQQMIDNKRAAAQRRLEEAARKEAELQRLRATGAMLLHHASHPLVRGAGGGARLVQRERKNNAKTRKRGARLKIEKLKTSGLLELTPEVLQGKSVRDAVLEKLNVSGGTLPTVNTTGTVDFEYEEIISLDDYDVGSRSVLETDAMLVESQAKRMRSRSQMDREAQDLRDRLEQTRTFRRESGLMNFPPDRLGPPTQLAPVSRASEDYRMLPDSGREPHRRHSSRSPARGRDWRGRTPAIDRVGRPRDRSRSRKRQASNKTRQNASPRPDRGRKRARSVERGSSNQASRGRVLEPMRIMHMQNIMDAPIPKEMAKLPPLAAAAVDPPAKSAAVHSDGAAPASEEKSEAPAVKAGPFKIPKLSAPPPAIEAQSSEKPRSQEAVKQNPAPEPDEAMGVDLDLEVSEEDRKFVESPASDNIGRLLDEFIGDKKSPEKSAPKPVLKRPEDTVKKLAPATGRKLSFADDPPKSGLSLMAAALKKSSKTDKSDEAELRHLIKNLSSAQKATFRKMLTSTVPSPKKSSKKRRK
jgi:hypothetical protein